MLTNEHELFYNNMKYLIAGKAGTILTLTEEIYKILEPYFEPQNPKLVKFEIVNYLLFRLYFNKFINITTLDSSFDYFYAYPVIFADYLSDPYAGFAKKEILLRNKLYVQMHFFAINTEPGTYSTENFFRQSAGSTDSEYGLVLQAVALKYGQGRVVAFSDSTCFSSFCMFTDGYENFNLGVFEYLNLTFL